MCTWFSVSWWCFRYDRKCLFSGIYNPQITISSTSVFSVNFNRNRVKNHLKPWTCPLRKGIIILMFLLHLASQQWHKNVCSHSQSSNESSFYLSLYTKIVTFNFPFNLSNGSAQVCFWLSLQYFTTKQQQRYEHTVTLVLALKGLKCASVIFPSKTDWAILIVTIHALAMGSVLSFTAHVLPITTIR